MDNSFSKEEKMFLRFVFFTIATSSIVLFEPAPYDLLMVVLFFIAFFYGHARIDSMYIWPVIFLVIFIQTNLISVFFARDIFKAFSYFLITFYLMITWFLFTSVSTKFKDKLFPYLFKAYLIAALFSVLVGTVAYFKVLPGLEFTLMEGRVFAFFKDPNVFGPFLIPPAAYALIEMGKRSGRHVIQWFCLFFVIAFGVLLSFSRAAWGQFVLVILMTFLLMKRRTMKRVKIMFFLLIVAIPILIYIVNSTVIGELFFARLGLQGYDESRFENQEYALENILQYPLGFGPGQSEVMLDFSAHSLYVRLIAENGILGFLSFVVFFFLCIGRSFRLLLTSSGETHGYFVVITVSLVGILFNSIFIDTIHWRHMWLLLALPWMRISDYKE